MLVPRHRGFDRLGVTENGQVFGGEEHLDAARDADAGVPDETIAQSLGVGGSTVYRTKRHFVEGTLGEALHEEPRPGAKRKLTGQEEALLVATACSRPPEGRARWTMELFAGEMVRLTEHDSVSRETVRRRLAENELKPWRASAIRSRPCAAGPTARTVCSATARQVTVLS